MGGKGGTVRMIRGKWWKRENMWKEKNRKNGAGPGENWVKKEIKEREKGGKWKNWERRRKKEQMKAEEESRKR